MYSIVMMLCCMSSVLGNTLTNELQKNNQENGIEPEANLGDGLILNRSMTRFGHRFYREFVIDYQDIGGTVTHGGLTIIEKATARDGSLITITHNRKVIFKTVISPANNNIDEQAKIAATKVDQMLKRQQQQAGWGQWLDPDLASDEF
ncbi:CsgE family curli-type amyloid fiber assembly protein [uncultured Shewanella sp.]|uniref:CsgE family curli-type amyloid fiber assembly protein n=1 Tax=uncultured Shewanella sp. TaxID=173975 RepID=UPI0026197A9F|nr:CsgE family curli-type amyloid fiber assembly protein [uncultured Shewanella sp.]